MRLAEILGATGKYNIVCYGMVRTRLNYDEERPFKQLLKKKFSEAVHLRHQPEVIDRDCTQRRQQ
jgi:hypothetical protein